jgi:N-acyl-D-aspartate/D-glutamate deacylase
MMWPIHLVLHLDSSPNRLSPGAARNTVDAANIPTDSNGNNLPGWYSHYTAVGSDWSRIQIVSVSNPDYRKYVGKRVSEMIADRKKPWLDVLFQA